MKSKEKEDKANTGKDSKGHVYRLTYPALINIKIYHFRISLIRLFQ